MKNPNKIILILVLIVGLSLSRKSFAANIYFDSYKDDRNNGDYLVKVLIDTEGELINAVGGHIDFPQDIVELKDISDGNSSINFWIDKPTIKDNTNKISFSGITPGGFLGKDKVIFSFILHQKSNTKSSISLSDVKVLKNDEYGSEVDTKISKISLPISTSKNITDSNLSYIEDKIIPEDFTPSILKDQSLFDGKSVLVFATQDKDSGIDHYEVKEGYLGQFTIAQSPYLLINQSLSEKIFIKAVDNSGNERLVVLDPMDRDYLYLIKVIIVIMLIVVVLFKIRKIWLKFTR